MMRPRPTLGMMTARVSALAALVAALAVAPGRAAGAPAAAPRFDPSTTAAMLGAVPATGVGYHPGFYHHRGYRHLGYPYWRYGYPWRYRVGPVIYASRLARDRGALRLRVRPKDAEVFLDGKPIGIADDFDGYPSYLWLEQGTYDLAFYKDGFRTLARQYTIYPDLVIKVDDRLEAGESVHPDDLAATSTVNRDRRVRRERERAAAAAAEAEAEAEAEAPGRLLVEVFPDDAAVYLDGHFLGTAGELAQVRAGLLVDPGRHLLEVVRPGFESAAREVEIAAGERFTLDVALAER